MRIYCRNPAIVELYDREVMGDHGPLRFDDHRGVDVDEATAQRVLEHYGDALSTEPLPGSSSDLGALKVGALKTLAVDVGVDLDEIEGTGAGGNIVKSDIIRAIQEKENSDAT